MIPETLLRFRRPFIVTIHLVLVPLSYYLAYALRFDFDIPSEYVEIMLQTLGVLVVVRMLTFWPLRLYHGWWRHSGVRDLLDIVTGVTISTVLFLGALFFTGHLSDLPRSIPLLDWAVTILMIGGARFAVRLLREETLLPLRYRSTGTATLMIGAGAGAEYLLRQFRRSIDSELRVVGLVDDDPAKQGMRLHGVPVLGSTDDLPMLVQSLGVDLLVIAIPSATRDEMRKLVKRCVDTDVEFKIVPPLREILNGKARLSELRRVQIEDLLGREPIHFDVDEEKAQLAGEVVLVTGGAGSIGSELARQIAAFRPALLVVVDQAESPLYFAHLELIRRHPGLSVVPVVADIADASRIEEVVARHRPSYVFHAAAYKHVPLMEENVVEAVRNNILGTLRVADAAARHGAREFVLISTDKAVHPSSVMGATKRIAERVVLGWPSLRRSGCDFRAVRFGNVLGSDGSVVPLFKRQISEGGPLTVTHPDVTRYFMTIPEAVQLVLQAAGLPEARGHICMLEMGEPVRIVDLAENMIRLSGLTPYEDVPIVFTGLRPGEKMHEELMSDVEETVPSSREKIRIVQTDETDGEAIQAGLDRLLAAVQLGDRADLLLALCALVPECVSPLREKVARLRERDAIPGSA